MHNGLVVGFSLAERTPGGHASIVSQANTAISGVLPSNRHTLIRFCQWVRTMNAKKYDRAYFDRWYRDPAHRVRATGETVRKVNMVVALAEYYLGRSIANVLDIGCGEGVWRAPLLRLRPGIEYLGLDSSEYAIRRFGRSRNLHMARFADLAELRFERRFDLIVCSDVAHYLRAPELRGGLSGFPELLEGLAFIELFTSRDAVAGDVAGFIARTPAWYRREFAAAGLMACGSHSYLAPHLMRSVCELERACT